MKNALKIIIELFKIGKRVFREMRKEKEIVRKKKISKSIDDQNISDLCDIILDRKRMS